MRHTRLLLALVAALLIISGCGDTAATTVPATSTPAAAVVTPVGGLQKVRLALDWTPNTNHIGFYVALANGWYKDEGVDLEILPYSEANTPDALVGAGQAELGISFMEGLAVDAVTKLPVKSVAAIAQHNTSALVTLKSSGLDKPAKLAGKTYAGFGAPYEEPVVSAIIKCDGAADGKFNDITANVFGYQALTTKQADFVWIYMGWEGIQARHDGLDLNVFYIKDYCVPDYYTPLIIANTDFLSKQPDLARSVMKATARGFQYAISNPDAAADLLIKANPAGTFPDTALVHESAQYLAPVFKGEVNRWGQQELKRFTDYPQLMLESGKLQGADGKPFTGTLDYAALFTNDFLP